MLEVVIHRVDAVITWHSAGKQFVEVIERDGDPIERLARPRGREKLANRGSDGGRGTDLNGVRNVVIVTAMLVHPRSLSSWKGERHVLVLLPAIYSRAFGAGSG